MPDGKDERGVIRSPNGGLVEALIGVLMLVFESVENNFDAKEQALMVCHMNGLYKRQ